jgi:hypothetical protein
MDKITIASKFLPKHNDRLGKIFVTDKVIMATDGEKLIELKRTAEDADLPIQEEDMPLYNTIFDNGEPKVKLTIQVKHLKTIIEAFSKTKHKMVDISLFSEHDPVVFEGEDIRSVVMPYLK